jgi:dienelactone hydrolase
MRYIPITAFETGPEACFDPKAWENKKIRIERILPRLWGKVPLKPESFDFELVSLEKKPSYVIEKVKITVENSGRPACDIMPLYILLPDKPKSEPCPAVIVHHQHAGAFDLGGAEPAGIAGNPDQAIGSELAERGYIAVCPDAMCFGERQESSEIFTAMYLFMMGRTLNFKYILDISRLIDYLETREEIDSSRIAVAGHSLGGQMAIWCAAYEPRLKAVLSNCGLAKIAGKNSVISNGITHNFAFYLPDIISRNIETKDIAGLIFPRPLFLSAGTEDAKFPIDGVAEMHAWLEQQYSQYELQNKIITLRHVGGHMMPRKTRISMYDFLDTNL